MTNPTTSKQELREIAVKIRQLVAKAIKNLDNPEKCDLEVVKLLLEVYESGKQEERAEMLEEMNILEKTLYCDYKDRWGMLKSRIKVSNEIGYASRVDECKHEWVKNEDVRVFDYSNKKSMGSKPRTICKYCKEEYLKDKT